MRTYFLIFTFSIITVGINKILKKKFNSSYFSLSDLIAANEDRVTLSGLLQLILPSFVGSFIFTMFLDNNSEGIIILYGLTTVFLIVWPILLYGEHLLPHRAYIKKRSLYLLYLLYCLMILAVVYGGYILNLTIMSNFADSNTVVKDFLSYYAGLHPLFQSLFANLIWVVIALGCSLAYKKIKNQIFQV